MAITPPTNGLVITSTGLAITAQTNGLTVTAPAEGLAITPPTGGLAITPPNGGLLITSAGLAMISVTTDVSATLANITDTAGSGDISYTVLGVGTWTFGIVNPH